MMRATASHNVHGFKCIAYQLNMYEAGGALLIKQTGFFIFFDQVITTGSTLTIILIRLCSPMAK